MQIVQMTRSSPVCIAPSTPASQPCDAVHKLIAACRARDGVGWIASSSCQCHEHDVSRRQAHDAAVISGHHGLQNTPDPTVLEWHEHIALCARWVSESDTSLVAQAHHLTCAIALSIVLIAAASTSAPLLSALRCLQQPHPQQDVAPVPLASGFAGSAPMGASGSS